MNKTKVRVFFKTFSKLQKSKIKIHLTGGIAAMYYGGVRPTEDIDFAISRSDENIVENLNKTSQSLGIPIQYSTDIQRWGMINIPNLNQGAQYQFSEGLVEVYCLAPEKWAVGKLSRFYEDDLKDLVKVFTEQKTALQKCLKYWKKALEESPDSSEKRLFENNIKYFLENYSKKIWGIESTTF